MRYNAQIYLIATLTSLWIAMGAGCVKRTLVVRSQPEGALVTIDNQTIGHTPLSTPYTYQGTRDVKLELDGFQTVKVQENVRDPWYLNPPFDFIVENFWPYEVDVERELNFQMRPLEEVDQNRLLDRASQLRSDVQRGLVATPHTADSQKQPESNDHLYRVPVGSTISR